MRSNRLPAIPTNVSSPEPPASSPPTLRPESPHASLEEIPTANVVAVLRPWDWQRWVIIASSGHSLPDIFSSHPIGWENNGGGCGKDSHTNGFSINHHPRSKFFSLGEPTTAHRSSLHSHGSPAVNQKACLASRIVRSAPTLGQHRESASQLRSYPARLNRLLAQSASAVPRQDN